MVKTEIDASEITRLQLDLATFRAKGGKDIRRSVASRYRTRASVVFRKEVTNEFTVRPSALSQSVKKAGGFKISNQPGAGIMGMGFGIKASSRMIGIRYFRGTTQPRVPTSKATRARQRKKGLQIVTKKGGPQKRHRTAFVADLNGPKWFSRKDLNNGKRFPLERVFGPSLYSMYVRRQKEINNELAKTFIDTAQQVLKYHEQKISRKNARR